MNCSKIPLRLTREEIKILIKATEWASQEYYKEQHPEVCIKVSDINAKLNNALMRRMK